LVNTIIATLFIICVPLAYSPGHRHHIIEGVTLLIQSSVPHAYFWRRD
jgi:hypothetical protein